MTDEKDRYNEALELLAVIPIVCDSPDTRQELLERFSGRPVGIRRPRFPVKSFVVGEAGAGDSKIEELFEASLGETMLVQ